MISTITLYKLHVFQLTFYFKYLMLRQLICLILLESNYYFKKCNNLKLLKEDIGFVHKVFENPIYKACAPRFCNNCQDYIIIIAFFQVLILVFY